MRIACDECNAAYELPPERVRPGRAVRCARCGCVWVPVAREDAAPEIQPVAEVVPVRAPEPTVVVAPLAAEPVAVPVMVPDVEVVAPVPEPRTEVAAPASRRGAALGWVLTVAVLAALGWAAVTCRAGVVAAWPPAERGYALLGLR